MSPCPDCGGAFFEPGENSSMVQGGCPNCGRPYMDQPTPLNSEMEMRDMPAPGEEDTGGNPLQEGILGDYQNRGVRDESFAASVITAKDLEPDFIIDDVLVPDPESIRPDKEQMDKEAGLLGDALPVAGGLLGGAVGTLIAPGVGTAIGAGIGAGLGGAGGSAAEGGSVGDDIGSGLADGAIGGLSGGLGGAALNAAGDAAGAGLEGSLAQFGSGAAEDAAAGGVTKGGLGSVMNSAWSKLPSSKLQQLYYGDKLLNGASGQMQQATTPDQGMLQGPANPSIYSAVETPTSHGEIPSNNTDDPEEVDFHENEEDKPGLKDPSVNDIGGTDLGPDDFFSPDSGALASFADLLPKILQFALGDQSAAGDPDMEELHSKLEAEKPGYMNSADDDHGAKLIIMLKGGGEGEESGDNTLQDNDAPHDPISEHEATALRPGLENTCPRCGGVTDPSSEHCPQCGMANPMHQGNPAGMTEPVAQAEGMPAMAVAHTAAGPSQGPQTKEQQAAVATLLQEQGRGSEVPTMLMEPWNFAEELAQITQQEQPPEQVGQEGPPPPVPPSQPGAMPMPGMSAPEGGPQMMAAVKKYATSVDGFCEHCPNCGSHSTGYMDYEEGDAGCKTCGHKWKAKKMVEHSSADEDMAAAPMTPELSQAQPEGEQEQTGSLSWTDESGSPLKVGQSYEMYSQNYDIPDRITVTAVKPDVIEYTINGEYGLSHQTELTHEEASVEGDSFIPVEGEAPEEAPEENQGAQPMDAAPGQVTDLSTPHEMMASHTADFDDTAVPGVGPSAGQPPVDNIQRDDVNRANRLKVMLMREGFPEEMAHEKAIDLTKGLGSFELGNVAEDIQALPETEHPMGPTASVQPKTVKRMQQDTQQAMARMGQAPPLNEPTGVAQREPRGEVMGAYDPEVAAYFDDDIISTTSSTPQEPESSVGTGPDWLMEADNGLHTAGAHMSPWEQRGYIEESGDARNSDKLQLGGTHYEFDDLNDSFLFGL